MAKLARLPMRRDADAETEVGQIPRLRTRYYAFLSYSHRDKELADWLHRELEHFRVPRTLAGKLTANGVVPRRLVPIFRDQHDLSAGGELAEEIKAALAASQFLVVLCSPTAAKSRWTNTEIESFKRTRPEGCVLAAVVAGEPFASDIPGREDEECFPPALRFKYDRRGHRTSKPAEPLAADFRPGGEGRRTAFLKLVAGMLGVGLDELVQRDQTRRHRQLAWLAAGSLAGMAVTSTLAVTAIQARDSARDQRREAEGLVAFMVGDLKDKLEPIGRLDALDGVGTRVLAYYSKQDTSELSDAALLQRSKALTLMAQVAEARGDPVTAERLYRQAMAGTAETVRRAPDDAQAIFDHAQNVFYIGQLAEHRGDFSASESAMREYQRLAHRMVALGPDNMKWRMEVQYADTNLGVLLFDRRRFAEAVAQFTEALSTIEAIAGADPANQDYQKSIGESLAWLGDAQSAVGHYADALDARHRDIAVLNGLLRRANSVDYKQRLIPAHRSLGDLYAETGRNALAIAEFRTAVGYGDALTTLEPTNKTWLEYSTKARADLARALLDTGQAQEARQQTETVCAATQNLAALDARKPDTQKLAANCWGMRARVALAGGGGAQALDYAMRALAAARNVQSGDAVEDAYRAAAAALLVGDVHRALGDAAAARGAWGSALSMIPAKVTEEPWEMALHASLLQRLGRNAEAQPLAAKVSALGYRGAS